MPRVFAVRVREMAVAMATAAEPGEFIVTDECAAEILKFIAEDFIVWGRENGKLVHPDD